ncbi:MAG TPA: prephenate dehydratase [Candidatus Omnitrophica bacterium]|nr:prephenate dehydratase [Candidatus Omnitrophota bacterium]
MNLEKLRKKVDRIDEEILNLLNERAELTLKIGEIKSRKNKQIYAADREKKVYENITKKNKGPLNNEGLKSIYREIMSASIALEKSIKVAYLGPPASFTHLASIKKFGSSIEYLSCDSITDVFYDVQKQRADYGVVPIENSTEGAVTYTLDMFIQSNLKICSEILLQISHNLIANCSKNKIKKIYSNPQVFGQCRQWLKKNLPQSALIEVSSTTRAAQLAQRAKDAAAIASEMAAKTYNLRILTKSIEDNPNNVTRFLVIGKEETPPTGEDKTSIIFSTKDKPGALYEMLMPFKKHNINLTKIESRPSKAEAWKYYFFLDLEGHRQDEKVKKALSELEENCLFFKILGSYPKGE